MDDWTLHIPFVILIYISSGTLAQDSLVQVQPDSCLPTSINISTPATGSDLRCYECKETYIKSYDPSNSPCRFNLSQVVIRECGAADRYCKVERLELNKQVMTIERGCVEKCPYGCRFNGYGLTYMRCTSCCRTYGCNKDNNAHQVAPATACMILVYIVGRLLV